MPNDNSQVRSSSTGHNFSNESQLDGHFVFSQPEYEVMLQAAGLQRGWKVLDAGCGVGSFLPLMSEMLGASGHITATDLAPENVQLVAERIATSKLSVQCPVQTRVGSVLAIDDAEGTYDAVWCSAVLQYLSDDELNRALNEFRRVVRPGGLVIIKDFATTYWQFQPMDPTLLWRWLDAGRRANVAYTKQILRNIQLPQIARHAGYANIKTSTTLVERFAPISLADRDFLAGVLEWLSKSAAALPLSLEDIEQWRRTSDRQSPDYLLDSPDYYYAEGHILVVAQVPLT